MRINRHRLLQIAAWLLLAGAELHAQTRISLSGQARDVDFTNAASTLPVKAGATLPPACVTGEMFFKTDAMPGAQIYTCAVNVWTNLNSILTVENDGVALGARPVLNVVPGFGVLLMGSDTGSAINLQPSVDTAVVQSKAAAQSGAALFCSSATGSDAYSCALSPTLTAYTNGMQVAFRPTGAQCLGPATLNIDTLGAKPLTASDGSSNPACVQGRDYLLTYDSAVGSGVFKMPATGGGDLVSANNLSDVANATTARTNLGLAIGTNVQAYDANDLTAIAALNGCSNGQIIRSNAGVWQCSTASGTGDMLAANNLSDVANKVTARANLKFGDPGTVLDVVADCGVGNLGSGDQAAAINACVQRGRALGGSSGISGATLFFPCGTYLVGDPIVLPRTGATPDDVVWLRGANSRCVSIEPTGSWSTGEGTIMWESIDDTRIWHQRIEALTIKAPSVNGTYAIHYVPTDKSTLAEGLNERIQIVLNDVIFDVANQFNPAAVYLEGHVRYSQFHNIITRVSFANWVYNTWVFLFDSDTYGTASGVLGDVQGCNWCVFEAINSNLYGGGRSGVIKGRVAESVIHQAYTDGTDGDYAFYFLNSINTQLIGIGSEGRSEFAEVRLEDSQGFTIENLVLAQPDSNMQGTIGIQFVGSSFNVVRNRTTVDGKLPFSSSSILGRLVSFDANSHNNKLYGFQFTGDTSSPVSDGAEAEISDAGINNYVEMVSLEAETLGEVWEHGRLPWQRVREFALLAKDANLPAANPAAQQCPESSATAPRPKRCELSYATGEIANWEFAPPTGFYGPLSIEVMYKMSTSVASRQIRIASQLSCVTPGDAADTDADVYASQSQSADATAPATAGHSASLSWTAANTDSMAAGDDCVLSLARVAPAGTDHSGEVEILRATLRW